MYNVLCKYSKFYSHQMVEIFKLRKKSGKTVNLQLK